MGFLCRMASFVEESVGDATSNTDFFPVAEFSTREDLGRLLSLLDDSVSLLLAVTIGFPTTFNRNLIPGTASEEGPASGRIIVAGTCLVAAVDRRTDPAWGLSVRP